MIPAATCTYVWLRKPRFLKHNRLITWLIMSVGKEQLGTSSAALPGLHTCFSFCQSSVCVHRENTLSHRGNSCIQCIYSSRIPSPSFSFWLKLVIHSGLFLSLSTSWAGTRNNNSLSNYSALSLGLTAAVLANGSSVETGEMSQLPCLRFITEIYYKAAKMLSVPERWANCSEGNRHERTKRLITFT